VIGSRALGLVAYLNLPWKMRSIGSEPWAGSRCAFYNAWATEVLLELGLND